MYVFAVRLCVQYYVLIIYNIYFILRSFIAQFMHKQCGK